MLEEEKIVSKDGKVIVLRVYAPAHDPRMFDPTLTLHNRKAVRHFVDSIAPRGLFADKSFCITAWMIINDLSERQVGESTLLITSGLDLCVYFTTGDYIRQELEKAIEVRQQREQRESIHVTQQEAQQQWQ